MAINSLIFFVDYTTASNFNLPINIIQSYDYNSTAVRLK